MASAETKHPRRAAKVLRLCDRDLPDLGQIFHQPLRQTQGFVQSLLTLMGLSLPVPDFSTLSRRAIDLSVEEVKPRSKGPVTLILDSAEDPSRFGLAARQVWDG